MSAFGSRFCKHLSLHATFALANALVSSRLLHSAPVTNLDKLQCVQNYLARVVTKSPRLTSSRPLLTNPNWLPIYSHINFKPHPYKTFAKFVWGREGNEF